MEVGLDGGGIGWRWDWMEVGLISGGIVLSREGIDKVQTMTDLIKTNVKITTCSQIFIQKYYVLEFRIQKSTIFINFFYYLFLDTKD